MADPPRPRAFGGVLLGIALWASGLGLPALGVGRAPALLAAERADPDLVQPPAFSAPVLPTFRPRHQFAGEEGRKLDEALTILSPLYPALLEEFGRTLTHDQPVEISPNAICDSINRGGFERAAFVDMGRPERVNLCAPFFAKSAERRAAILGHELLHTLGLWHRDLPGFAPGLSDQELSHLTNERVLSLIRRVAAESRRVVSESRRVASGRK